MIKLLKQALFPNAKNIISILTLVFGLSLSLVLFSNVTYIKSFDKYNKHIDDLYIIDARYGENGNSDYLPDAVIPTFKSEIPEIKYATNITYAGREYLYNNKKVYITTQSANSDVFEVFDLEILKGNLLDDFKLQDVIYVSEKTAKKVFGDEDPIGKILFQKGVSKTVKGVFADIPENSYFKQRSADLDAIVPRNSDKDYESWYAGDRNLGFIVLEKGANVENIAKTMKVILDKHYDPVKAKKNNAEVNYYPAPMSGRYAELPYIAPMLLIMSLLTVLVVIVSSLNYTLISISSLSTRLKEIAVRKCNGSSRYEIGKLILNETIVRVLFSLLLSVGIIYACRDIIAVMFTSIDQIFSVSNIWSAFVIVAIIIMCSALIPSFIFSNISVMNLFVGSRNSHKLWKKVMLFTQIFLTTAILYFAVVGDLQYSYMFNKNVGYDIDKLIYNNVQITDNSDFDKIRGELMKQPNVESVSFSNRTFTHELTGTGVADQDPDVRAIHARFLLSDSEYFKTTGVRLIYGKPFVDGLNDGGTMVSRTFVKRMKWVLDESVIGKVYDAGTSTVVGVFEDVCSGYDFLNNSASALFVNSINHTDGKVANYAVTIRLSEVSQKTINDVTTALKKIEGVKSNNSSTSYFEEREYLFEDVKRPMDSIALGCLVVFFISIIGLYGYISNELQFKYREMAVRKLFGASVPNIIGMIYKPIFYIVIVAVVIGMAVGIVGSGIMFDLSFPDVMTTPIWVYVVVPLSVIFITYLVVFLRSLSIAMRNPVDHLSK